MSFFSSFNSDRCPCGTTSNPVSGLNEKVCIQVKKVFDACLKQVQESSLPIVLTNQLPAAPTYPLTFVSARSTSSKGVITNLAVTKLVDRDNCSRVQCNVTIPLEVIYVDSSGIEGKAQTTITLKEDVVLFIPNQSIIPYEIEAVVSCACPEGNLTIPANSTLDCCISLVMKVVIEVELLVPSYGYCPIPPCQEYTEEQCAGFFELPLFPTGMPRSGNCNK